MLAQQFVNGILTSGIYALFAVGFAMVFGILGVLNMAHADFAMVAALCLVFAVGAGLDPVASIGLAILGTIVISIIVERVAIRPSRRAGGDGSIEMPLIATIGVSMVLENTAALVFGNRPTLFPFRLRGYFNVDGVLVSKSLLVSALVAALLLAALEFVVGRTDFGRQIRAVAQNRNSARIMGINADRIIVAVIVITATLSGIAGGLVGMSYGFVSPFMAVPYAIKGLIAMIIGGVGSLRGAVLGALLLGAIKSLSVLYLGSELRDVAVFVVLMTVLLLRPEGLVRVARTR